MSRLLPYETILKAREGDPEAVNAVLLHYAGYIRYFSKVNGQVTLSIRQYDFSDTGRTLVHCEDAWTRPQVFSLNTDFCSDSCENPTVFTNK